MADKKDPKVDPKQDSTLVDDSIVESLWGKFPFITDMKGFGPGAKSMLDLVPASTVTGASCPSEAVLGAFACIRQEIDRTCAGDFKGWMNASLSELIQDGLSQGWTVEQIMRRLNKFVGRQHALDGKLFEALIVIVLTHFLGAENITIYTQTPTGSDVGGHLDIEVQIGDGRFLIEVKTKLGNDWKRSLIEHQIGGEQQPYFLITVQANLKPHWIGVMKEKGCQPVSINPSMIPGVVHLDALVSALKKEIEKAKEQKATKTV